MAYWYDLTTFAYLGNGAQPPNSADAVIAPANLTLPAVMQWNVATSSWKNTAAFADTLTNAIITRTNGRITTGVSIGGVSYDTGATATGILKWFSLVFGSQYNEPSYFPIRTSSETSVQKSPADTQAIAATLFDHVWCTFEAERLCMDDIYSNSPTITTTALAQSTYDGHYTSLMASPVSRTPVIPSGLTSALDDKQDHTANLDFWTDVAPNTHIEDMMSHASKTELHDYLEVGTAAFEDVEFFAAASHTHTASNITDFSTAADARITAQKGAANGLAPLNSSSKIDAAYLPSYVDDVLEYANLAGFPGTGADGNIYVDLATNKIYRWSGSAYVEISPSPGSTDSVTEGSTNLYFTNERAQDAVGAALSSEFVYNDGSNSISLRTRSFTNNASRSTTTGTGATGFQVSSSRDALVNYSVTISTAVQIGVATNVDGYAVLEIAPTNSATAGDWIEIARTAQAQNIGLALALSSTQKGGGNLTGVVPAGYYAKIRTVNTAGTPTYTYNSGQEVLL